MTITKIHRSLRLISAPAIEPVTLVEARLQVRQEASGSPPTHPDDDQLTTLIAAARKNLDGKDGWLGRALITQTWELVLDAFPSNEIRLPLPPLQEVTSVKYDDLNGAEQTVDPADYEVDTDTEPGWIVPVSSVSWPSTLDAINAVRIRYVAGYGVAAANVPEPIRQAMLLMLEHWYDRKDGTWPAAVEALLAPYRIITFT